MTTIRRSRMVPHMPEPPASLTDDNILLASKTPLITNVVLTLANTEYSVTLETDAKIIEFRARGNSKLRYAWVLGETASNWISLPKGCVYSQVGLRLPAGLVLYVQSDVPGEILELEQWV